MRRTEFTPARPDVEVIKFTPKMAEEWLGRNVSNRSHRERVSRRYAYDMVNGDWRWTGDPLRVTADGALKDGQHRLKAVVIAGETDPDIVIPFLVVVVGADAQEAIDTGIPRKLHDVLKLRGEMDAGALAAVIRLATQWDEGVRRSLSTNNSSTGTHAHYLRTLEAHPELRDVIADAQRVSRHCELPASIVGLLWWAFDRIDETSPDDARFFFDRLADGQGLVSGDPIYELRKTLDLIKASVRGERSRTHLIAITIKAWNAYRRGDKVGLLRYRSGGAKPEAFPEPI